ncbi:MAG: transketolase [Rhodocyclaceae bacterium]|nr:transketolase [Rhodocyclaceae bacterium]
MNPSHLIEHGQSYWIDNLTRRMINDGALARRVGEEGLGGVTSNPSIFHKAISTSRDYDDQVRSAAIGGRTAAEIYEALTTADVRAACDILRPLFDRSGGRDGFVSIEVSPHLAHDTEGSIAEARRLRAVVDRPNLFIKIPGTAAGVRAVEELLFAGINVNITLLFAIDSYLAVAQAYLRALERRLEAGLAIDNVASVASFFLSRIDVLVDQLLGHYPTAQAAPLLGKAGIANAKLTYRSFRELLAGERWQALARRGARPQRVLWASTSTKNPTYRDVMYVEPLIGPDTVNTLPEETIAAFADHGEVADTVAEGVDAARRVMQELEGIGIDLRVVAAQLENEGVQKFIDAYDALLALIDRKRDRYRAAGDTQPLELMARKLRREVIAMTTAAGSGHPTSCMSCADIVAALFFREMRWDPGDPKARNVDSFILSKGHAAPIWWAALHEAGAGDDDLLSLRRLDSPLEGHPTPNNPWVRVATGSLGQGLAAANGIALANRLDGIDARVYCLLGDGECSEGSVWEAAQFASLQRLSGLVAIVDVNGLAQSGPAPYAHDGAVFARRFQSFGWKTFEIDGHDLADILYALQRAREAGPAAIIARTEKGKGVSFLEGALGWHGKPLDRSQMEQAYAELGAADIALRVAPRRVGAVAAATRTRDFPRLTLAYRADQSVATREAYGSALKKLGGLVPELVALDGDVKESTHAQAFAEAYPERFFECAIAEQNMVGTGLGLAASGKLPFVSTFACFLTRAADFIRMAGHSRPPQLVFCGSHAGVSIGADGPSQMGLEDLALFRAVHGSTILYPCDAVSAERLTEVAARTSGIVYLRTSRPKMAMIYDNGETFAVGGSKTLRASARDAFTIVAAGITVHEALAAHDSLKRKGIVTRVIDAYSVKPIDADTLARAARETRALFVVEDHWIDAGLGDAVAAAVASLGAVAPVHRLGIADEPRSGTQEELLERYGISRHAIERKVMEIAHDE